jgi:hypothetical protein
VIESSVKVTDSKTNLWWEAAMKIQDALAGLAGGRTAPICRHCESPMKISTIVPTMLAHPVDDIVYVCPNCGIETKQTVRRAK